LLFYCARNVSISKLTTTFLSQIRSGILDETYGHVGECVKRYRLSLAIILGLLSEVKSENDRHILLKYENGLQIRIENLHGRRRLPNST